MKVLKLAHAHCMHCFLKRFLCPWCLIESHLLSSWLLLELYVNWHHAVKVIYKLFIMRTDGLSWKSWWMGRSKVKLLFITSKDILASHYILPKVFNSQNIFQMFFFFSILFHGISPKTSQILSLLYLYFLSFFKH